MKILFLFTLICSLGFFTACSDDDDNDTPTPTPPEVNLAKEIEGLYNACKNNFSLANSTRQRFGKNSELSENKEKYNH